MELAAEFPPVTRADWQQLALSVLRRSGLELDDLSSPTYDGLTLLPLYDDRPAGGRFTRSARGWDVRQRHAVPDPEAVLADLENGVTSLWLVVGDDAIPVGELPRVLAGVYLDLAPIVLQAGPRTAEAARALLALAAGRGVQVTGNLGAGPGPGTAELARRCVAEHPGLRAVTVDATPYHDAGGGDAQELGCSLALGVAHLRELTAAGLDIGQALGQLEFRYAATADQFATIAKLRAARRVWARVAEVCGGPGEQAQHAVTSSAMMTARDPWVNMLRTTLACFAAGAGGADAVTVQPFDAALGLPDGFARRIARNTQSLLLEESGVGRVIDPAGGSFYVEHRTAELAERAWAFFQELQGAGDGWQALAAGRVAATRERRAADVAHRRVPITGVSEFPAVGETPVRREGGAEAGLAVLPFADDPAQTPADEALSADLPPCGTRRRSSGCVTRPTRCPSGRWSSWPRSARSPRTPRGPRSPPTSSRRAAWTPAPLARGPTPRPSPTRSPRAARGWPACAQPTSSTPSTRKPWPPR
ncbi:methylmalonyl-CoA mutase family protein [Nonomuraea sp. NBC_01738]|uniref:methylmalonyl-CoA mutase subunit beta n=1 Tax=Nonomuraea sp. NBC_01738 TaxID=2976003 RepID=UPI002E13A20D|nr:methylmalonyl-CoA mutase family protein [Nonomuraea sp. NBC_01738]